ncbi:MAG: hypothetical protein MR771_11670 [Treponema succinifaciens]|uniref:hypothetical protein n=1 Tax=Treponema succinifaciens TaxID=167 RepID=UPI002354CD14|nr:hypothetical protein [Treponema succinifaciens]MCI6913811.1 hypothetical protein [Treponema succinifaciens]
MEKNMLLYHGSNVEVSNPKISDCIPYILQFYDNEVSLLISNKYGYPIMDSYRKFLFSKTYQMLCNPELEMWEFSPAGIFDIWEAELVTGEPRNSLYLRRD